MLFNSYLFLFFFLPGSLVGYQMLSRLGRTALLVWLALVSLCFYGYWNPAYLVLLIASMLVNFGFSQQLGEGRSERSQDLWLTGAIVADLLLLIYYKYLFPFLNFLHAHHVVHRGFADLLLPLGISFFTFTQIAYLIDLRQSIAVRQKLLPFSVFVSFFPHLIAGPILRPREIMPQLERRSASGLRIDDVSTGMCWFVLGLAKKVLIADRIAPLADAVFRGSHHAGIAAAWLGAIAYTMQLYFDFSGYSDMALGLARMFSIEFPVNFDRPFRSSSVIEFWQRWHMTLSRYLTEYLYTPILRRVMRWRRESGRTQTRTATPTLARFTELVAFPLMATMLIAGIWHGAGIQFLVFGLLQGVFLTVNHAWRQWTPEGSRLHEAVPRPLMTGLTFLCWLVSMVFFRSGSMREAGTLIGTMFGLHGVSGAMGGVGEAASVGTLAILIAASIGSFLLPNVWQVKVRPSVPYACGVAVLLAVTVLTLERESPFLYFQF